VEQRSRRALLDELDLPADRCLVSEVFEDGQARYQAVADHGLEAWSRSVVVASTGPATAAGSRSRIRATGAENQRSKASDRP
jgi:hypothetical protein